MESSDLSINWTAFTVCYYTSKSRAQAANWELPGLLPLCSRSAGSTSALQEQRRRYNHDEFHYYYLVYTGIKYRSDIFKINLLIFERSWNPEPSFGRNEIKTGGRSALGMQIRDVINFFPHWSTGLPLRNRSKVVQPPRWKSPDVMKFCSILSIHIIMVERDLKVEIMIRNLLLLYKLLGWRSWWMARRSCRSDRWTGRAANFSHHHQELLNKN